MRGIFRSEPELTATFTSLNARRVSNRTKTPGDISQFKCEAFVGQNQNSWQITTFSCAAFFGQNRNFCRRLPIWMRGVFRPEPKLPAIFPSLNARCLSARTKSPGGVLRFECDVFFGQNQNSWRSFPIRARGVFRPEPKSLVNYQFEREALFRQNPNSCRYFPV